MYVGFVGGLVDEYGVDGGGIVDGFVEDRYYLWEHVYDVWCDLDGVELYFVLLCYDLGVVEIVGYCFELGVFGLEADRVGVDVWVVLRC